MRYAKALIGVQAFAAFIFAANRRRLDRSAHSDFAPSESHS
jgi:hypothetical protein